MIVDESAGGTRILPLFQLALRPPCLRSHGLYIEPAPQLSSVLF
jgi:hypothetical protein